MRNFEREESIASTNATFISIEKFQLTIFLLNIILRDQIFC